MSLSVGVYGGSGYAGSELVRLLSAHPKVGSLSVASRGYAGRAVTEVYPHLVYGGEYVLPERIDASGLDVAFVAYGHRESAETVRELLEAGAGLVVDLSADFRLPEVGMYEEWYGAHPAPELFGEAHYGLPEVFGAAQGRRIIANPGCYPTAALLALAPVVRRAGGISSVTINALSGVSGAGAKPAVKTHFVSANENANAYGVSDGETNHRHTPEIETMLRRVGECPAVTFVPHLIPATRGEFETITVEFEGEVPDAREVLGWYAEDYGGWRFVEARENVPQLAHVANTNRARLSAANDRRAGKLVLFAALDNLLKGASGAAVQNMNLALGYAEDLGLEWLA
ncbi:argC: N-acetyl-gamma-glutamyl-phosphate reductase [Rubrobacter radiotolerans]|uniref:N-acetyl-gamma-glutamyl-phosphate reductase n=1 Tax=Rubrobacter radiotolerans TaxID=42256 RepID=A0A023X6H2_RUBRA|nr:N-acetyl-gamma-glutamyl-phosphate reductase [Rubrobacter radiotolerans]AHY47580.1 argC: N-acetyl-gamma-glutamyl-phosphate reductase [Rubrobacter radiotolerans]MDX5894985.1 N-acetyl-gamma-glutamyl-phosphate reductase [Rubrobacter radiotolerans]SMC07206.1 N-acetyl-gamma-glutamyl-phosphate reductase [Rubrobacter radiotolerans DSM 5868]